MRTHFASNKYWEANIHITQTLGKSCTLFPETLEETNIQYKGFY